MTDEFKFTDEEWREYQQMPEQGYSHRNKLEYFVNRWLTKHDMKPASQPVEPDNHAPQNPPPSHTTNPEGEISDEIIEAACEGFYTDLNGLTDWRKLARVEPYIADKYREGMRRALTAVENINGK